nr:cytochrome c1 [Pseudomonadota bacterium]
MKKMILTLLAALGIACGAQASESEAFVWDKAPSNTNDLPALQNGAKLFVNYCLNCHSAAYMRYNRLRDIGLSEDQIKKNLLFATDKVGETMKVSLDPRQARDWFGAQP